jgi:hypothetical protein
VISKDSKSVDSNRSKKLKKKKTLTKTSEQPNDDKIEEKEN